MWNWPVLLLRLGKLLLRAEGLVGLPETVSISFILLHVPFHRVGLTGIVTDALDLVCVDSWWFAW